MIKRLLFIFCLFSLFSQCKTDNPNFNSEVKNSLFIHDSVKKLSDVIVHDIFSPPVASRVYVYPAIAAYEALRPEYADYATLAGQLHDLNPVPQPDSDKEYCLMVSAIQAYLAVSQQLIFSEDKIKAYRTELYQKLEEINIPAEIWDNSIQYGDAVAQHILDWANHDNYKESRSFPKLTINDEISRWKPTPPGYMESIEPHWNKIRPFVIEDADQFTPAPPTPFSLDKSSLFYEELMEVYGAVKNATDEHKEIASFWDCNPYVMNLTGHVMFASKKITPGGHWIGITRIACEKSGADPMKTLQSYALVSIALADGFISCWDEKYRSVLIRPETVINEHLDENWVPVLQTPPFPEYTSGHSVISTAAAVALTSIYGPNFSYEDDVELEYGLPVRSFNNFMEASAEAAISRLYGGIHYRPAIDQGVLQGNNVGEYIVEKIKFH